MDSNFKLQFWCLIVIRVLYVFGDHVYKKGNYDEQYIGCYQDNEINPDLEIKQQNASMKISYCLNYCRTKNRTYAGIQNGTSCFCGDRYGKYGLINECSRVCPGSNSDHCGGNVANSIYAVCPIGRYGSSCSMECHCANEAPCFLTNGTCPNNICASGWIGIHCSQTSVPVASLSHYGCFVDARNNSFPQISKNPDENMTITLCMDRCRTRFDLYAGLQYRYQCFCGNGSYATNRHSTNCGSGCEPPYTNCSCPGSPKDRCGGPWTNDVYSVCPFGYYGVLCSQRCHCREPTPNCTMENGTCPIKECASGWTGSACNIRNCSDNNGDCSRQNEICKNEVLGNGRSVPRCRCRQGYNRTMEYENCTDVDECSLGQPDNQCDSTTGICKNTQGSYNCTCQTGYENNGSQACQDINECLLGLPFSQCDSTTGSCFNFPGTYNCTCKEGYENNGTKACQDVDECLWQAKNGCDNKTTRCQNTLGSFSCHCLAGYMQDESPMKCLKDCSDNNGDCAGQNEICQNEVLGNGRYVPRCRCRQGYNRTMEYENCNDIDDCLLGLPDNQCDPTIGICMNTKGSYHCVCKAGYENNGTNACQDINECSLGLSYDQCDPTIGLCFNFPGDYNCTCKKGYKNNGAKACQEDAASLKIGFGVALSLMFVILVLMGSIIFFRKRKLNNTQNKEVIDLAHCSNLKEPNESQNTYTAFVPPNVLNTEIYASLEPTYCLVRDENVSATQHLKS